MMVKKINFVFVLALLVLSSTILVNAAETFGGSSGSVFGGGYSTGGFSGGDTGGFGQATNGYSYMSPSFDSIYTSSEIGEYWPILARMESGDCEATQDFLVGIPPGGCTPAVVRSDLLEEQNVPVFCKLDAVRINPLIKVSSIKSISFKGDYPADVAGISFHPARAAIRSYNSLLGSPVLSNIGYVVIILKQNKVEDEMPEWIAGNLTATIRYDSDEAYGTGQAEYYLPVISDDEWESEYEKYGFWNGRGYLRATGVGEGVADIKLYNGVDNVFREFKLKEGETSNVIYYPGFYCKAGLKVKLNSLVSPEDMALLKIDGNDIWVREGSKVLNGKCSVRNLDVLGDGTGAVKLSCPGNTMDLMLQRYGVKMSVAGDSKGVYAVGDFVGYGKIDNSNFNSWYVGYAGKVPDTVEDIHGKDFVVLTASTGIPTSQEMGLLASHISTIAKGKTISKQKFLDSAGASQTFTLGKQTFSVLVFYDSNEKKILVGDGENNKEIVFNGLDDGITEATLSEGTSNSLIETYFTKSLEATNALADGEFYNEKKEGGETYGEEALFEEIKLARELGKQETEKRLVELFIEKYPSSDLVNSMKNELVMLSNYDYKKSFGSVLVDNVFHSIVLTQMKPVGADEKKTKISVGNRWSGYLSEGDTFDLTTTGDKQIRIEKIEPNYVTVVYLNSSGTFGSSTYTLKLDEPTIIEGRQLEAREIDVKEVAYVSLVPEIKNDKTEANFTFKIGIEKRAIELSPEKTKEMIKNLNKTIADWEAANEKLGEVIKGWKGACFATSALMMMKSMASGFSGESLAREKIMKYYKTECGKKEYAGMTATQCYNELSSEINADVQAMQNIIQGTNAKMDPLVQQYSSQDGLLDKRIENPTAYVKSLQGLIEGDKIIVKDANGNDFELNKTALTTSSEIRAVLAYQQVQSLPADSAVRKSIESEMNDGLRGVVLNAQYSAQKELYSSKVPKELQAAVVAPVERAVTSMGQTGQGTIALSGQSYTKEQLGKLVGKGNTEFDSLVNGLKTGEKASITIVPINGAMYLYPTQIVDGEDTRLGKKVYEIKTSDGGTQLEIVKGLDDLPEASRYTLVSGGSCQNKIKEGSTTVRYYESGTAKGMPALVPFDLQNGWYVMVSGSSLTGNGYQASGDYRVFTICNVGADGIVNDGKYPDDVCQTFDTYTSGSVSQFIGCPSMSGQSLTQLVAKARQAISQAQNQYGQSSVNILGNVFSSGSPMTESSGLECQDLMSPEDCLMMFNVCDPVICPSSRCNLGGKMQVSDVIQTGIIGSLLLCLPNAREGIMVPICLTGVHAGIDTLVSIMKSGRDCLEENLESGKHVGICDEITSIYLCEFLWRQVAPMIDILIPKIIEFGYGQQGVRGGGEYLTVQSAWDNLDKSINYFQSNYAQNAFQAFRAKNVEEAGGEFCKAFIGTSVPTSVDAIESLLEPESPSQFYAWFSETTFSEATVPATSQYKVYFHIYAGNDRGTSYQVYLKDPPSSGYYRTTSAIPVKTGYISKGNSADESIDFTAPEGYKQLCVVINAEEHCGFKQVASDFGINYLSKKYVEEQATQEDITSQDACLSGTPSALALVNPNLQAGVETAINPDIATSGIIRICATADPNVMVQNENSVDSTTGAVTPKTYGQWRDVGYCGDPQIRCWLDVKSVEDDLKLISTVENKSISTLESEYENMQNNVQLRYADVKTLLNSVRTDMNKLKFSSTDLVKEETIESRIKNITDSLNQVISPESEYVGYPNADVAWALSMKSEVYRIVIEALRKNNLPLTTKEDVEKSKESEKKLVSDSLEHIDDAGIDQDGEENKETSEMTYSVGEPITRKIGGKTYYFKYTKGFLGFGQEWQFSTDKNSWNSVLSDNLKFGTLALMNFEEGIVELDRISDKEVVENIFDENYVPPVLVD